MTFSDTPVEVRFEFASFFPEIFCGEQVLPFTATTGRHRVSQAKSYELNQARKVAVRQITALMPSQEAEDLMLMRKRFIPFVLMTNQFSQILALGFRRLNSIHSGIC